MEDYRAAALKVCLDDVARLTRFDADDLVQEGGLVQAFAVAVHQTYQVTVDTVTQRVHGESSGAGRSVGSSSGWQEAISALRAEALAAPRLTEGVLATVSAAPFAGKMQGWSLGTHGRSVYWRQTCSGCRGRGRVTCTACGGSRQTRCAMCGGAGRTKCSPCWGAGGSSYTVTEGYPPNERQVSRWQTCIHCGGAGENACHSCGQRGWVSCSACGASGEVTCGDCGGTGSVTDIASFRLVVTPTLAFGAVTPEDSRARSLIVGRIGIGGLAAVASQETTDWERSESGARVTGLSRFEVRGCELVLRRGDRVFRPYALGPAATIWDYDGVVEDLLEADLTALEAAAPALALIPEKAEPAAFGVVRAFCENEANQALLAAARTAQNPVQLKEAIKGTVSVAYAERVTKAMSVFVARLTRRHMAVGLGLGTAAAVLTAAVWALLWWGLRPTSFGQDWELLGWLAPTGWLLGAATGWLTASARLKGLGGEPLKAFTKRKDLGLGGRLKLGWRRKNRGEATD
ncbi:hypothetical protein GVN21_00180 [Caulobacter sp. SLTY]|uniref:hypothetical protein n=1 Tax=Caulobacter sp. SLTY TaxID=2683262 RepID=UPI00141240F6|nr:hypothetical protein [Caulobacter sp. SLTY]NBB13768.1 hypothetical protein [Caulobacter sp. SLTY]